jgi:hypothetical protein
VQPMYYIALDVHKLKISYCVKDSATSSNTSIRQCFPGRRDLFGCPRPKPSQGSVPADLTLASDLAFVLDASRVEFRVASTH